MKRGDAFDRGLARAAVHIAARTEGYIYFIACGEFVKIGHSATPRRRPKDFATCNPYDCTIIGIMLGGMLREAELHKLYNHLAHRNEWFRATPDLLADIEALCGDWSAVAPHIKGGASLTDRMLATEQQAPGHIRQVVWEGRRASAVPER